MLRQRCSRDDGPCSASSVASESPMISQAEVELLMWVGLRPLPDRVRKPKLRRQRSKGGAGVRPGNQGLQLNIVQDCQTGLWELRADGKSAMDTF